MASGSTREILALLKTFRDKHILANADFAPVSRTTDGQAEEPDSTRPVFIGRSFGGFILFSALSEYLIESLASSKIINPFGDLVILVNPAFEATGFSRSSRRCRLVRSPTGRDRS